jgi:hypothetical protein
MLVILVCINMSTGIQNMNATHKQQRNAQCMVSCHQQSEQFYLNVILFAALTFFPLVRRHTLCTFLRRPARLPSNNVDLLSVNTFQKLPSKLDNSLREVDSGASPAPAKASEYFLCSAFRCYSRELSKLTTCSLMPTLQFCSLFVRRREFGDMGRTSKQSLFS